MYEEDDDEEFYSCDCCPPDITRTQFWGAVLTIASVYIAAGWLIYRMVFR